VIAIPGAAPVARHHATRCAANSPRRTRAAPGRWACPLARDPAAGGRLALHPTITLLGLALPALAGGAAVVEVVFSWPGLGRLQQTALLSRDFPLALGGLLATGALVIAGGVISDVLSALVDPRWRRASEAAPR